MISESFFKVYNASAGSGKTFTLVKEYLKIVLTSGDFEFQKILAITFTNKAAAEMKQRVLTTLKDASVAKENQIVEALKSETGLSDLEIQEKSKRVLKNILHNYASFNIITIDSFTHKLIRTFSLDLGLPLDFEVEMDAEPLLEETIDLLIAKIGEDKELTDVLVNYAIHQVNDDKSWNISDSLIEVAKLLLNEENEIEISKLIKTNLSDFKKLEKNLRNYLKDTEVAFKEVGTQALSLIDENDITYNSFTSSAVPNYFKKLVLGWNVKEEEIAIKTVQKCFDTDSFYAKAKPKDPVKLADRDKIDEIKGELYPLFDISQKLIQAHFGQYFLVKKILKTLVPLAVLSYINKEFSNLKEENNFRLNAEFNRFISNQIKDEPVPFIYERLGEKFQYFFIDEMQDTSELQWQNLIPLIHNTLSQKKGGLMLVGDAKQSIYRWRGGKASQFVDLSNKSENQFFVDKEILTLNTNYRSYSNVINFNNQFFSFISSYLKEPVYQDIYHQEKNQGVNNKKGGYVKLEVFEREEEFEAQEFYAEKIHQQILQIEENGFNKGDICVLTRKKANGIAVADYLVSKGIEVISPDSLLLKNNQLVQFFIRFMRWLENKDDKEELIEIVSFFKEHLGVQTSDHEFYETCIKAETSEHLLAYLGVDFKLSEFFSQSLYDGLEYIVRAFKLQVVMDVFGQAFLDLVLQFQLKESGGLQSFLAYWNRKREKLTVEVSPSKNAVQIMTIHKSKGLEFPVVIFPFDLDTEYIQNEKIWYDTQGKELFQNFESFQIPVSSKLTLYGEQGDMALQQVNQDIQLDNFNLLYVALTRAEEQLFILCDTKKSASVTTKNYSDYFMLFMADKGKEFSYEVGDATRISKPKESEESWMLKDFMSTDKKENQIVVVQNQDIDDEARLFGNLIHQAFEKIITIEDLPVAYSYIHQQGLSTEVEKKAKEIIYNVIHHPELKIYYKNNMEVYNERSFLTQSGEVNIMDRVVFNAKEVTIIDYKTGVFNSQHQLQIENYGNILKNIGYVVKNKYLVYCNDSMEVLKV
ncbi:ATP-dependent exoDNAse (exonuclease V) beta subunit [Wenyingzhuangia heitensis]|uniref:DNA 3'-5' helicase n=1 Tax=Wenyingzhuangia heitensis TaxID=1487859 RepID=A0ABX0U4F4_9FLAO|nr:UvrD-helicase domain-containing protein [Wenyingzhuangia heitensis]NIJ43724.1 ATP-dependent exoDNAse (exonuclease V) beta subunit [Wenyingzhuangia heitensis]